MALNNMMNQTTKSDLMECIESIVHPSHEAPLIDVKIVDGATLVHTLDPKKSRIPVKTFQDYAKHVFLPYISQMLQNVVRIDLVWDVYKKHSLKTLTRQARGVPGNQLRIANNTSIPINRKNFLRLEANKEGLFRLLATALQEHPSPAGKTIISTYGDNAISSPVLDLTALNSTHEEADTRMLLHAFHALQNGLSKVLLYATDTDIIVITIAMPSFLRVCEL